ncbi:MAG: efflux RND transporter periplasmic adaptor subunit [Gammaproteobacteria bacterium]|nr:efflux RND transporter periplasmic adaptor subunit [Gammaproteobacteria bacterium]MCP5425855.1 efflux RND transporter periplasmic adaptor subunit [Gammaproteobacteria bacterium]MCP5458544.1 efflux RND transporter periplasmic adaptor subunit [Gammaproteobacteria bacterium]
MKIRIALLLLALIAAGAFYGWRYFERPQNPSELITLYGNVDVRQVDLAFNGTERITALFSQEGDHVSQGQLLATLATERLAAKVAQAEAELTAQQQVVARLEAGARREEINQARAELDLAQAQDREARRSLQRIRELARQRLASPQQVDDAEAAAEAASARVKAAEAGLELVLAGPRKEDIAAARATLQAFQAQLALANRELLDAQLFAPDDGVIQNRILEPGDMASPQKPVYTLALINPLWARAYIDEPLLGKMQAGMTATVHTDSFPDKPYPGWIGFISPSAEFTPKTVQTVEIRTSLVYQVRVFVCNPANELRLGMPVTVTVDPRQTPPTEVPGVERCRQP